MKNFRKLFMLLVAITMTLSTFAQVNFELRSGINLATMEVNGLVEEAKLKFNTSYLIGGMVGVEISDNFGIESGLLLSGKGTKLAGTFTDFGDTVKLSQKISLLYLEVPFNVLFKKDIGSAQVQIFAGPYFAYGVAGEIEGKIEAPGTLTEKEKRDLVFGMSEDSDFKPFDGGLNFGLGIEFSHILLRAQYGLGIVDLNPRNSFSNERISNKVIGISIGYVFGRD